MTADLTEDELVKALETAQSLCRTAANNPDLFTNMLLGPPVKESMALLEAARLIRVLEWAGRAGTMPSYVPSCLECEFRAEALGHREDCSIGRWARAATRAGL